MREEAKSSTLHDAWTADRFRSRALFGTLMLASTALGACGNSGGEDRADLNAILEDGDLTQLTSRALSAAPKGPIPPPTTGSAGTTGSSTGDAMGSAGTTGFAGTAGSPTGFAGSIMTGAAGECGPKGCGTGFAGTGGGMGGSSGGPFPQSAQGLWQFEDCNSFRTDLADSSFNFHPAFRSVSTTCQPGQLGQGVFINEDDDYVYVPDQPTFGLDNGLTVAAWVKPLKLGGVRTIFRKREGGTSSFALVENAKTFQLVIRLSDGKTADVSAPAKVDTFAHVAGTYDGVQLRLYVNGVLAAHKRVAGVLSRGNGPLLMGNDASARRIDGVMDSVFFDVFPATPEQILRLACLPHPSTISATPSTSGLVAAGTPVSYDVKITNNSCDTSSIFFNASTPVGDISANPSFDFRQIEPGASDHIPVTVSSSPTTEPDDFQINFSANLQSQQSGEFLQTSVTYSVLGTPCSIRSRKELEIRDLSVVEDPVRTAPGGAWTFGKLMESMAPTAAKAPAMVEALLSTWLTDQNVNGFTVGARPSMQDLILSPFPRKADGTLDLDHAPFRLLAIVNRIDLNDLSAKSAGEGRFVFGLLDQFGNPLQMTMIVEYNIPTSSAKQVTDLANAWHGLSALPFPSAQYNTALQAITDTFTKRDAAPGRPNGSALGQLRSNDFFTLGEWEFREFHLSAATGNLQPVSPALTPDRSFNGTDALARFINQNQASILTETHTVPSTFEGQPFAAGSMITDFFTWQAPGVDPEARHKFAVNTCNGCHTSPQETGVFVFQVNPRQQGQESFISPFLTGTQVVDGFANVVRNFNELGRRARELHDLVCPGEMLPPPPPDTIPLGGDSDGGIMTGTAGTGGRFDGGFADAGGSGPTFDGGVMTGTAGVSGRL